MSPMLLKFRILRGMFFVCSLLILSAIIDISYAEKMPSAKRPPLAYESHNVKFHPSQVIVRFKDGYNADTMRKPSGFKLKGWRKATFGFTCIDIDGDVIKACNELNEDPSIDVAEPNYIRYLQIVPNDPLYRLQNNLALSRADLGWNIEQGDADVVVAVIDTGIDKQHPDMMANLLPGFNLKETSEDENDDSGHGTAVSGVLGAIGNNATGIAGAAWNIRILPLRACGGPTLTCFMMDEIEAIEEAIVQGVDIINLSLGGTGRSTMEETAINNAWNAGILIIAAVGNYGLLGKFGDPETEANIHYPAGYDNVIGVGSVDYPHNGDLSQIKRSDFSNYGDAVSLTAVGSDVITTAPTIPVEFLIFSEKADYGRIGGTSFSTPLVSGLAALIKSHFPNISNAELRAKIENSARDIGPPGWDNDFGFGLIDFQKAMIGSTHASNEHFNMGITTSPIFNDDVIIIVKVKVPIEGNPLLSYSFVNKGIPESGFIPLLKFPNQNNIWSGRFHTLFSGNITFRVNGISTGGGNLSELLIEYSKGKSF